MIEQFVFGHGTRRAKVLDSVHTLNLFVHLQHAARTLCLARRSRPFFESVIGVLDGLFLSFEFKVQLVNLCILFPQFVRLLFEALLAGGQRLVPLKQYLRLCC